MLFLVLQSYEIRTTLYKCSFVYSLVVNNCLLFFKNKIVIIQFFLQAKTNIT